MIENRQERHAFIDADRSPVILQDRHGDAQCRGNPPTALVEEVSERFGGMGVGVGSSAILNAIALFDQQFAQKTVFA